MVIVLFMVEYPVQQYKVGIGNVTRLQIPKRGVLIFRRQVYGPHCAPSWTGLIVIFGEYNNLVSLQVHLIEQKRYSFNANVPNCMCFCSV